MARAKERGGAQNPVPRSFFAPKPNGNQNHRLGVFNKVAFKQVLLKGNEHCRSEGFTNKCCGLKTFRIRTLQHH